MNRTSRTIIATVLFAFILGGCDPSIWPIGGGGGGGNGIGEDLSGVIGDTWRLTGFQESVGNAFRFDEVPADLEYTLTFGEDRRAGGNADCKGYSYAYRTEKGKRSITFDDPAPQIAIVCNDPETESRFYHGMQSARNYMIDGDKLVIYYGDRGEKGLHFERVADVTGIKEISFVPFSLVRFYSRPYTLEPPTLIGNDGRIKVRIEDDILYAPVQYSGGCVERQFDLYANEDVKVAINRTGFYSEDLLLVHSADRDDPCEALPTETRLFDLTPLREKYRAAGVTRGDITLTIHKLDGSLQTATVVYSID